MSKKVTRTGICPHCKKRFDADQYISVNAQISPELKEKVLDGTIFDVQCPFCQKVIKNVAPILYHDMKKRVMVQLDEVCALIIEEHSFNEMQKEYPLYGKDAKFYGATSYVDFLNKVRFVECGIDPIYGQVVLHHAKKVVEQEDTEGLKEEGIDEEIRKIVAVIEIDNGSPVINCITFTENYRHKTVMPFPKKKYKKMVDEEGYDMSKLDMDGQIFDDEACEKTLKLKADADLVVAIVKCRNGLNLVEIPTFNKGKFKEGDEVLFLTADFEYVTGEIIEIYNSKMSSIPVAYDQIGLVERKCDDYEEVTARKGSDEEVDNTELLEKIRKSKAEGKVLPAVEMRNAEVIIGCDAQFAPEQLSKAMKDFEEGREGVIPNEAVLIKTQKTNVDGKTFVNVYFSQDEVPKNTSMKVVYCFDDLLTIVKQLQADGVIVNPNNDAILLSVKNLFEDYCPYNVMCDAEAMKKLLAVLTKDEIDTIGEKNLEYIKKVYLENKKPKEIAEEMKIDEKLVHRGLDEGYEEMMWIVRVNYYNFATKKEETK